tara:strand:+ start:590 stop:961 length:372 start_codon:yes stop_codon:yes gene_type:complete
METIYIVSGIFSSILIFLLGYLVKSVRDGKKEMEYLESYIEDIDMRLENETIAIHTDIEATNTKLSTVEIDIRSQLDSRIDKLTNQIMKITDKLRLEIPPTNDELMKRIEKIEEESYRLRMNM